MVMWYNFFINGKKKTSYIFSFSPNSFFILLCFFDLLKALILELTRLEEEEEDKGEEEEAVSVRRSH